MTQKPPAPADWHCPDHGTTKGNGKTVFACPKCSAPEQRPSQEVERLIERLSPLQCDCDDEHTEACMSFGRLHEYIRTLQREHRELEAEYERLWELYQDMHHGE